MIIFPIIFLLIGVKNSLVDSSRFEKSGLDINLNKASLIILDLFSYLFFETNLFMNFLRFSLIEMLIMGIFPHRFFLSPYFIIN